MRTIALKQVADVAAAVEIPVVGMGGVEHGRHAAALLAAGAAAVAVGTASFRDPLAAERIRAELAGHLPVAAGGGLAAQAPKFRERVDVRPGGRLDLDLRSS